MEKVIIVCNSKELDKEEIIKKIMLDFNLDSSLLIENLEVLHGSDELDN